MDSPAAPEPVSPVEQDADVSRRSFLAGAMGGAGVATVSYFWIRGFGDSLRRDHVEPTAPGADPKTFTPAEWRTLEAACNRLLPSGPGSPGASEVNAIGYLDAVLQDKGVNPNAKKTIRGGAAQLDARARKQGARDFAALSPEEQDAAIRVFETATDASGGHPGHLHPGHLWIKRMLSFIFEAFFGDPVHGGNPDEIAWKWAGHRPGYPRPTEPNWRPVERKG